MAEAVGVELDAQYRQMKEECGLPDRSGRGKLLVEGAEAAEYLQGQLTNDIEKLEVGEGCYAALLDRKGHMQADMRVLNLSGAPFPGYNQQRRTGSLDGEAFWLDMETVALEATRRHLQTYKIGREVEVEDVTAEHGLLSLIGPRSAEVAGSPPLPEHSCEELTVAGIACLAVGTAGGQVMVFSV